MCEPEAWRFRAGLERGGRGVVNTCILKLGAFVVFIDSMLATEAPQTVIAGPENMLGLVIASLERTTRLFGGHSCSLR